MRVLFVEDEAMLRDMVGDVLAGAFDVELASDGAEAINLLRDRPPFDVVVSDIAMPGGVSGIDVAHEALALNASQRVVLLSGHARSQLPELPNGVEFLGKPYRIQQLIGVLNAGHT
jgi:CheY-like chemotaxis protein